MATISKIRKHSGWVIAAIGLAMLGFLVSDVVSTGNINLFESRPKGVGTIYGENVDPNEFRVRYETALTNYRNNLPPEESISPALEGQISDEIWNQLVMERIYDKEWGDLGLNITGEEIMDLTVGPDPHPVALQYLISDREKGYERDKIYQFITAIQNQQAGPDQTRFWLDFEKYLVSERSREKYFSMVKNGIFVTDLEAKETFISGNRTASVKFVPLFNNTIADSAVEISNTDYKNYFNLHKEEFKREQSRAIEYVAFDVNARREDTATAEKWISQQLPAFRTAKNDSSFVVRIGRSAYKGNWQRRGELPADIEEQVFAADSGQVLGPVFDNGTYKLVKVVDTKQDSIFMYKASHILIKPEGSTEADSVAAFNKARDIMNRIKAGSADFTAMAAEHSQDPSNAGKGGDLSWFQAGTMVKRFGDAIKRANNGDIFVVRTEFGSHIVKITAPKSNKLVKTAVLERRVQASGKTEEIAYTDAQRFRGMLARGDDFQDVIAKKGLSKRLAEGIKPNDKVIPGMESPREVLRWMYDAEKGSISDPIRVGNKYVVAHLVSVQEEGYAKLDDIREEIKPQVIAEKKKEMLYKQMQDAYAENKPLEEIAKAVGTSVNDAEGILFQNPFVPNLGQEPYFVGYAFGMKPDVVSKPLKGENGVYVLSLKAISEINAPESLEKEKQQIRENEKGRAQNAAMNALREGADVKDLRYVFF